MGSVQPHGAMYLISSAVKQACGQTGAASGIKFIESLSPPYFVPGVWGDFV